MLEDISIPNDKLWMAKLLLPKLVLYVTHLDRWHLGFVKPRYSGAFQEDREQLPGSEGGKQPKLGMDGNAGGSPLNCPLMPAPDTPQPLAVPAGLSLCGRHVWSWLAGVLAWRSHLSIIDPSFLSLGPLCLPHTTSLLVPLSLSLPLLPPPPPLYMTSYLTLLFLLFS